MTIITLQLLEELNKKMRVAEDLFKNEVTKEGVDTHIKSLNQYYLNKCTRYSDDANEKKCLELLDDYETLFETMKHIKAGNLTAENALKQLDNRTSDRKINALIHNTFKACELLFWLAAAIGCYAFYICNAVPMMFVHPPVGLILALGAAMLMFECCYKASQASCSFKTFSTINKEDSLERNLFSSFFQPIKEEKQDTAVEEENSYLAYGCV